MSMKSPFNSVCHYVREVLEWCEETGNTTFTNKMLPDHLKRENGGLLLKAIHGGYFWKVGNAIVNGKPNTRVAKWKVVEKKKKLVRGYRQ